MSFILCVLFFMDRFVFDEQIWNKLFISPENGQMIAKRDINV